MVAANNKRTDKGKNKKKAEEEFNKMEDRREQ